MSILLPFADTARDDPQTVFEDIYNRTISDIKDRGIVERSDVVHIIRMMQKYKMDCHTVIAGQNGVGKSYMLLMLMKDYLGKADVIPNMLLAKHNTNDFIRFILINKKTILGVDELNQYLHYKQHMDAEQNHLITQLELARSNSIGIAGCVRDPRKLTLNYRQGKMSIVIWILDRFTAGGSYAAVFISNPSIESYDKFGFSMIADDIINMAEVRNVFETMPSFVGYMRIPDINTVVSEAEIKAYDDAKELAMAYAHINKMFDRYRKRKITYDDVVTEIEALKVKFGPEEVERLIDMIPKRRSSRPSEED